jgi:hypothetical protein
MSMVRTMAELRTPVASGILLAAVPLRESRVIRSLLRIIAHR